MPRPIIVFAATATLLALGYVTRTVAAEGPTYAKCEALAEERGSGPGIGARVHREFMTNCMQGRIPPYTLGGVTRGQRLSMQKCEQIARQRNIPGAHLSFIERCMRGEI
jgi:hypothetical protein